MIDLNFVNLIAHTHTHTTIMYIYKAPKPGNLVLRHCTIKKEVFNKITKYNEYTNN